MARIILSIVFITLVFQSPLLAAWHSGGEPYTVINPADDLPAFPDNDPDPADEYSLPESIYRFEQQPVFAYAAAFAPEHKISVPERPDIVHTPPPRMH